MESECVKVGCLIGAWAVWLFVLCCAVLCWSVDDKIEGHGGKEEVFITFLTSFKERDQPFSF